MSAHKKDTPKVVDIKHRRTHMRLAIAAFLFGPYQRERRKAWIKKLVATWDRRFVGVIHVSRRSDGSLYVLDGQHRVEAARICDPSIIVDCLVYDGLTLAEEAQLFRMLDEDVSMHPMDNFLAAVIGEQAEAVAITSIAAIQGYEVGRASPKLTCASALCRVYRMGHGRGTKILTDTLAACRRSFSENPQGDVVHGIGILLERRGDEINLSSLSERLSKRRGGQPRLIGDGRSRAEIMGGSVALGIARVCLDEYNKGRTTKRIESF